MAEYDSVIPAGGSGTLRATIKTSEQQSGSFSKSIRVETDAEDARYLILRLKAQIEQVIVAKPRMFLTVTVTEGETPRGGILLHRADGVRLEVHGISSGNPSYEPRVTHVSEKTVFGGREAVAGDVWLELVGDPSLQPGTTSGTLRLETNHPDLPSLQIPYTMRVRPLIVLRPDVVRMWPTKSASSSGSTAIVVANRNDGVQFSITGIDVSHPEVFSASNTSTEPGIQHRIVVRLASEITTESLIGSVDGWVVIRTDDPKHPVIEMPVIVAKNRTQTRREPRPRTSPATGTAATVGAR